MKTQKFAKEVLRLTNEYRAENGLNPLKINKKLNIAAERHSKNMAKKDFVSHIGLDGSDPEMRAKKAGYKGSNVENIAGGSISPKEVVVGWMDSAGHRENILDPSMEDMGLGYFYLKNDTGDKNYNHYWTQVFGRGGIDSKSRGKDDENSSSPLSIDDSSLTSPSKNESTKLPPKDKSPSLKLLPSQNSGLKWKGDILQGTRQIDNMKGRDRSDKLVGLGGDDLMKSGSGEDRLYGGKGDDSLFGGDDDDRLYGGANNDRLSGDFGDDILFGGAGNDILRGSTYFGTSCQGEIDTLIGGAGSDTFVLGREGRGLFYGALFNKSVGIKDYALIKDFSAKEGDVIQLSDNYSYTLGSTPDKVQSGIGIFATRKGYADELVAVVQGDSSLDLKSSAFQFV